ncbi:MAG: hypothetical protein GJT30_03740 [Geobacter sp.]|nr:hypothetical protein [Geobacter sp.]
MKRLIFKIVIFCIIFIVVDNGIAFLLKIGLNRYYGFDRNASILIVGHSRAAHGIDGAMLQKITNRSVAKYSVQGTTLADHIMMYKHYISEHPGSVKTAVYIVDDYLFCKGFGSNQYRLFYPFMDNKIVDRYIYEYAGSSEDYITHKLIKLYRYCEGSVQGTVRMGFAGRTEKSINDRIDINKIKKNIAKVNISERSKVSDVNIVHFKNLITYLRSNNIQVYLFYMPFVDLLSEVNSESQKLTMGLLRELAKRDSGIILIDDCVSGSSRYDLFIDATHPNRAGQKLYTNIIAQKILSNSY